MTDFLLKVCLFILKETNYEIIQNNYQVSYNQETNANLSLSDEMNDVVLEYMRDEFIKAYYESFKQNESIIVKNLRRIHSNEDDQTYNSDGQTFIQHYFEAFQKEKSNQSFVLSNHNDIKSNKPDVNFKVLGLDYDFYIENTSFDSELNFLDYNDLWLNGYDKGSQAMNALSDEFPDSCWIFYLLPRQ